MVLWEDVGAAVRGWHVHPNRLSFNDFTDVDEETSVASTRTDVKIVAAVRRQRNMLHHGMIRLMTTMLMTGSKHQHCQMLAVIINALAVVRHWQQIRAKVESGFSLVVQSEELYGRCCSESMKQSQLSSIFQ